MGVRSPSSLMVPRTGWLILDGKPSDRNVSWNCSAVSNGLRFRFVGRPPMDWAGWEKDLGLGVWKGST